MEPELIVYGARAHCRPRSIVGPTFLHLHIICVRMISCFCNDHVTSIIFCARAVSVFNVQMWWCFFWTGASSQRYYNCMWIGTSSMLKTLGPEALQNHRPFSRIAATWETSSVMISDRVAWSRVLYGCQYVGIYLETLGPQWQQNAKGIKLCVSNIFLAARCNESCMFFLSGCSLAPCIIAPLLQDFFWYYMCVCICIL